MRDKLFYSICFGFILGVLIRSFVFVNFYVIVFICTLSCVLFLFFTFLSKNRLGIIILIFLFAFSIGIFVLHLKDKSPSQLFENKVGYKVRFQGLIIDEPSKKEFNQVLNILVNEGKERTEILVRVPYGDSFKYGDIVSFSGILEKPENFITDQGKTFDYINYLRKDGIYYLINYGDVQLISAGGGNFLKRGLFSFKNNFLDKINFAIPNINEEATLMSGLILGERSSFSSILREDFIKTGTIHIVALSGYNVTLVSEWIMRILFFFPKNFAFIGGVLGIILFVLMSGGVSTAVRAGVMAILTLVARATGRDKDIARILLFAAVLMIIFNPFILVYDVSFQLSFMATIAVIFLTPRLEKYFYWVTKKFSLRDIMSVTFSAYIFVLPFVLYKMGNLSLVAIPVNALVLPFIQLTMILGFLTGLFGFILPVLSLPFGFIAHILLAYEIWIIKIFAGFSFASFPFSNFPLVITIFIYLIYIYVLFWKSIRNFFKQIQI